MKIKNKNGRPRNIKGIRNDPKNIGRHRNDNVNDTRFKIRNKLQQSPNSPFNM
jgi:hypothetical protein